LIDDADPDPFVEAATVAPPAHCGPPPTER